MNAIELPTTRHVQAHAALEDYALIGDCHTAALISRYGSIDWLCLPVFSSAALFCALLDRERGGCWHLRPCGAFQSKQSYVDNSNVLQTRFECSSGTLLLTDCMVLPDGVKHLQPQCEIVRIATCIAGEVDVETHFEPRPNYGLKRMSLRRCAAHAWQGMALHMDSVLQTDLDLVSCKNGAALWGKTRLRSSQRIVMSWAYADREVCVVPAWEHVQARYEATLEWWRNWSARCTYSGPFAAHVKRSALTLKLLTSALTGGVVAAATTSIPEREGTPRNWDYRYCWVRDSAFAMRAFMDLGYEAEGMAFQRWLLRAVRLPWSKLQVMYDLWGNRRLKEKTLSHLRGYRNTRPVRVGNAASEQFQADLYGELIAATADFAARGGQLEQDEKKLLKGLAERVCKVWRQPDKGIWEKRNSPRHHTFSKVMCWIALEQLLRIDERTSLRISRDKMMNQQKLLRETIEEQGFNSEINSYVSYFGSRNVDASLLLLPRYGYIDANDPKMRGTFARIDEDLSQGPLVWRYRDSDGVPGEENTFLPCAFWAAEYLALAGRCDWAEQRIEQLLSLLSPTGLASEELSAAGNRLMGNYPQALTHESLIGAVLSLSQARSNAHD